MSRISKDPKIQLLKKLLISYRSNLDAQKARIQVYQHLLTYPDTALSELSEEYGKSNARLDEYIGYLKGLKGKLDLYIEPKAQDNIVN
jgi:hypothetical protein